MNEKPELLERIETIENVWIPLSDGTRLAARIWLPKEARKKPVPAILEYIPYRKRDFTRLRDSITHPYFAAHGYASIRVDIRGSGDSDGILTDEYLEQEMVDGEEILRWIARQPWCNGSIGMIGISWGGFNSLQLAYRQPPELKAIITACSTDDRYADDVHYMGGCLLGDNLSWASVMLAYNACPPDPEIVGDRWRELWKKRLEGSGVWLDKWLRHQTRDAYWKHGSICEDFSRIKVPVLAVGGWADGYSNAVFRLIQNLKVPRKGLIGPWGHRYPHIGLPGPAIGFLQEAVRWWDHWLKGIETGTMEEPMLRVWMQESVPPTTNYETRPGRWIGEESWPSPNVTEKTYALEPRRLVTDLENVEQERLTIQSPLSVGLYAGKWCASSAAPDLPHDQREEDGGSMVMESRWLDEGLEILGAPRVELDLTVNRPVAMIAVRLSDVAPDHAATRITYGVLNLTHRNSHEFPEPLEPGKTYRISVPLNDIAYSVPQGHAIRLSISTSYWPLVWLPPESVRMRIFTGESRLFVPVREPQESDQLLSPLGEPEGTPPTPKTQLEKPDHTWRVIRNLATDESTLEVIKDEGVARFEEIDLEIENRTWEWYTTQGNDFNSAQGETRVIRGFRRKDWSASIEGRMILRSTPTHFHLHADLDAYEGRRRKHCHSWDFSIPRNLV